MHVGFFLPHIGPAAEVSTIIRVAKRAEDLKYDSLWVTDRLLFPVNPQTSYYGRPLPEQYKRVFDPLETLTFVSAHTSRIGLGTSVLDIPFYNPIVLARQLTTLDQIKDDVRAIEAFGPDELIVDPTFSPDSQTEQGFLKNMEEIRKMV